MRKNRQLTDSSSDSSDDNDRTDVCSSPTNEAGATGSIISDENHSTTSSNRIREASRQPQLRASGPISCQTGALVAQHSPDAMPIGSSSSLGSKCSNVEASASKLEQLVNCFKLTNESLALIKAAISSELELGLRDEDQATIKMLITYVRELSRGDEFGSYLALDLGGTHFRVLLVDLNEGTSEPRVTSVVHDIPKDLLVTRRGQELFDYIALKLLDFVTLHKLKRRRISLGFTFSFPCKQYGLTQSVLVKWCKGFNVGGIVGTDVVKQLKDALKRQLAGRCEAYIDVVAVINDTTGTLVACANKYRECRIGLIVGTGFNACYMEQLDRCDKWPANYTNPKQVIINCEWGAMGDHRQRRELDSFRNEFDQRIDADSVNPMNQTYEKMVAGMYVGELLRLACLRLLEARLKRNPTHRLNEKDVLDGRHLSLLAKDELAGSLVETTKILAELNIQGCSQDELAAVVKLASAIMNRSAHLVACGVSALLERCARQKTIIGYDGSLIKHHPYFLSRLVEKTAQMTAKELKFEFIQSSDGSGIGAAVVAAALHKERRPLYIVKNRKLYELHFPKNASQASSTS